MDSIEKGIVKLVSDHGIKSLVIGTTSYSRYVTVNDIAASFLTLILITYPRMIKDADTHTGTHKGHTKLYT